MGIINVTTREYKTCTCNKAIFVNGILHEDPGEERREEKDNQSDIAACFETKSSFVEPTLKHAPARAFGRLPMPSTEQSSSTLLSPIPFEFLFSAKNPSRSTSSSLLAKTDPCPVSSAPRCRSRRVQAWYVCHSFKNPVVVEEEN